MSQGKPPKYDTTSARRQRRRRAMFNRMRDALRQIEREGDARSQALARDGLDENFEESDD